MKRVIQLFNIYNVFSPYWPWSKNSSWNTWRFVCNYDCCSCADREIMRPLPHNVNCSSRRHVNVQFLSREYYRELYLRQLLIRNILVFYPVVEIFLAVIKMVLKDEGVVKNEIHNAKLVRNMPRRFINKIYDVP